MENGILRHIQRQKTLDGSLIKVKANREIEKRNVCKVELNAKFLANNQRNPL